MKTYFTADLHLDHHGVLAMSGRPFTTITDHDNHLIERINDRVGRNDRLFVLGDVAWHSAEGYIKRLTCQNIHLIWGNHDRPAFARCFKTCEDVVEIKCQEKKFFLSHYPHAYWPSSHRGAFHLYGHTHRQREATLDALFPGRRSMDVGVDNARHLLGQYRPFSEDEVIVYLRDQPGHDPVEFYDDWQARYVVHGGVQSAG